MLRKVTSILRHTTHTNSGHKLETPFTVVSLAGCVHEVVSEKPVGEMIECESCGNLESNFQQVRNFMTSPEFSHVTRRSTAANRCRAWEHFCFYRRDKTSPTQCQLAFMAPACDEIDALIRELGSRAVPGPSRGEMAML